MKVSIHSRRLGREKRRRLVALIVLTGVSIHSRRLGREKPLFPNADPVERLVSIHSRRLGREKRMCRQIRQSYLDGFQSTPAV